ncbi:hypothetical protein [Azospirillum palustre]
MSIHGFVGCFIGCGPGRSPRSGPAGCAPARPRRAFLRSEINSYLQDDLR